MNRLSRISTIWRKEFADTLRDRRTVIAMVLVPMVLYPALMLGSLQAFQLQDTRLKAESYDVAVANAEVGQWLRAVIDTDPTRRAVAAGLSSGQLYADDLIAQSKTEEGFGPAEQQVPTAGQAPADATATDVWTSPPVYNVHIVEDVAGAVEAGLVHAGVEMAGQLPKADDLGSTGVKVISDQTDDRSRIAARGLDGILWRANRHMVEIRLRLRDLDPALIKPLDLLQENIATPEKLGGSILGQIVPLILIVMTITGAIYPAIDLTAGERERGTLETLMVAPVPTVDLIAGKFVVVTCIGMMSAVLNLASVGGTIYLGGLGEILSQGGEVIFPFWALPWILLLLIPLAIMFSAMLLAVCSFARSFKEAQNYVMPVMIAALIPAVVGVLPGMRLQGPVLIAPVTNIVVLTRDLFMGRFDVLAVVWVTLSTCIYAGAAVAVAAKLFGQEAVLFSDSGSIRTLFKRKFFKPRSLPPAAHAFLLLAIAYPLNYFIQVAILKTPELTGNAAYLWALTGAFLAVFVLLPLGALKYTKVDVRRAFGFSRPPVRMIVAALCFGCSTWILAQAWLTFQQGWLRFDTSAVEALETQFAWMTQVNPFVLILVMAVLPAFCEELFFRGYALSGLRRPLGRIVAVAVVAFAFGIYHQSLHRLILTVMLGLVLGLLLIQARSIWPAILAHLMHNGLTLAKATVAPLRDFLDRLGFSPELFTLPPTGFLLGAGGLFLVGILLCLVGRPREAPVRSPAYPDEGQADIPDESEYADSRDGGMPETAATSHDTARRSVTVKTPE